jgi:uncharacterized membrane protein
MSKILAKLGPIAKAVAAAVIGAVLPFVSVGVTHAYDWKAIASAAVGAACSAVLVYLVPNRKAAVRRKR